MASTVQNSDVEGDAVEIGEGQEVAVARRDEQHEQREHDRDAGFADARYGRDQAAAATHAAAQYRSHAHDATPTGGV